MEQKSAVTFGTCAHCGQAIPTVILNNPKLDAERKRFCCEGCFAVNGFLIGEKFEEYYELLAQLKEAPPSQNHPMDEGYGKPDLDFELLDRPELRARFRVSNTRYGFFIPSLRCAACIWLIEKALNKVTGVADTQVQLLDRTVTFSLANAAGVPPLSEAARLLLRLGYEPFPLQFASRSDFRLAWERQATRDLAIAGAVFGNVMLLAAGLYFGEWLGMGPTIKTLFRWLSGILVIPALFFPGRLFFAHALESVKAMRWHIDLPIAVALLVSLTVSYVNLWTGGEHLYFDSVSGLIFLLLAARQLNARLLERAKRLTDLLPKLLPASAACVKPGDEVSVLPGQMIPADGIVIRGQSEVNEALLTGEHLPVLRGVGMRLRAGTQNMTHELHMLAQATGQDTWIAGVLDLVQTSALRKSKIETIADAFLPWFVAGTVLAALGAGLFWWLQNVSFVVPVVVAVLIVSCPCAFALATPLTMAQALKKAWDKGLLIKNPDFFERLSRVRWVVCDKTGTLTQGHPQVVHSWFSEGVPLEQWAQWVCGVAAPSRHPYSRAIVRSLSPHLGSCELTPWAMLNERAGQGIWAQGNAVSDNETDQPKETDNKEGRAMAMALGSPRWLASVCPQAPWPPGAPLEWASCLPRLGETAHPNPPHGGGAAQSPPQRGLSWVGAWVQTPQGDHWAFFGLTDAPRSGVHAFLKAFGHEKIMVLSGDRQEAVDSLRGELGLPQGEQTRWLGDVTPEQKLRWIEEHEERGERCLMLGDGVNDAAALSRASVSIAVQGSADAALCAADCYLSSGDLNLVQAVFRYSCYVVRTLHLLIIASVLYNVIAVAFAIGGLIHPLVAALIMPMASLTLLTLLLVRRGDHLWES